MTMSDFDEVTARAEARVGSVLLGKYRLDRRRPRTRRPA
jgi:hypothetical protein